MSSLSGANLQCCEELHYYTTAVTHAKGEKTILSGFGFGSGQDKKNAQASPWQVPA